MGKEKNTRKFRMPDEFSGERADVALSALLSELSRSRMKKLIESELVLLDGQSIKPATRIDGGENVTVTIPAPQSVEAIPQNIPVTLLYEDDDIAVVDKPAGMVVHPGAGNPDGTLVNALLFRCRLSDIGGKIRPGIVHRLDKDTSGVMVVAKNDTAHRSLVNQFKSRTVKKIYLALVSGDIQEEKGSFTSPIGRHPTHRKKMSTQSKYGKRAVTFWKVAKRYGAITLVRAMPKTGRTHQIRVHFAENGYPLLMDELYGFKRNTSDILDPLSKLIGRQALHASTLGFSHPRTGERMKFGGPLPSDMKAAIRFLEKIEGACNGVG